jgi:hypothetical protein
VGTIRQSQARRRQQAFLPEYLGGPAVDRFDESAALPLDGHFFDKGSASLERSILGFRGEWKQDAADALKLSFKYKRANQTEDEFILPRAVTINRTMNQLMYEYDKKGQKFRLQFMGLLKISDDFVISYELDDQKSQNGDVLSKKLPLP